MRGYKRPTVEQFKIGVLTDLSLLPMMDALLYVEDEAALSEGNNGGQYSDNIDDEVNRKPIMTHVHILLALIIL